MEPAYACVRPGLRWSRRMHACVLDSGGFGEAPANNHPELLWLLVVVD